MVTIVLKKNPSYIPLNLVNLGYGVLAAYLFNSFALVIFSIIVSVLTLLIIKSEHKKNGVKVVLNKSFAIGSILVHENPK